MVGRVGVMLRFEGEAVALAIHVSRLARNAAVEEVPGVKLYSRFGRKDVQRASARRLGEVRRVHQAIHRSAVEDEVVVLPGAVANLGVLAAINPCSDGGWRSKIERRVGDRGD